MHTDSIRSGLAAFSAHYDYDAGYLLALLDADAQAHAAFATAMPLSRHRQHLPLDAHFVARICAMQGDDCGACTQLNVRMAVEAGVPKDLLRTLLGDPAALPADLRDVRAHALGVVAGHNADPARLGRLRARYGDAGVAELATAITGSRLYPTLKRALGMQSACALPTVD